MIILFSAGGRTGNQLFQLSHALSARRKQEWLVTFAFGKTRGLLSSSCKRHWLNIESSVFRFLAEKYLYPVLHHLLINTGIVSHLHDRGNNYTMLWGKLRFLVIMKGFFESSPQHSPDLAAYFRLNRCLQFRVRRLMESLTNERVPVFVHIRRADFQHMKWMVPDRYYPEAVSILQQKRKDLFFIIVGDDPDHAEILFEKLAPKYVSRLTVAEDLAMMSMCEGGVLSNSTFAWWGAFFGHGGLGYVVPKYWYGFKRKTWHPPEIQADFMSDFVEIS
jgi:hypothetical protein